MSRPASQPARASGEFAIGGNLPVVRLGYGTMQLPGPGVWGEPRDHGEAVRVLRRAVDLGVTLIDTADSYGPRVSERLIREALHPYQDDLVIATKAGLTRPGPGRWERNGKPEYLRAQAEESLRLLGLERIELFHLHRIDPNVPLADQLGALVELQAAGKIGRIGLSVLDYCDREGIGFIPWFPMATGALASRGGPLRSMADRLAVTPAQIALAWLLQRSPVLLPIPGTSTVSHLEENVDAARIELTPEQVRQLDAAISGT